MIPFVCPHCRGSLDQGEDAWDCSACGLTSRTLRGIPNLRTGEDIYLSNQDDWALAQRLEAAWERLDFRGLLELYYDLNPEIAPDLRDRQIGHILTAGTRVATWVEALGSDLPDGPWLDLGCGSGSFLAAMAGPEREVVGLDVAMRWLLVARKRLDGDGLGHIPLGCGNAERLPFPDQTFAAVIAGDVIEHVDDQAATLAEAHRVLMPGGKLFMATPNRFSVAPEPHVGVWGVGFLPRKLMGTYVSIVRQADFRAIRTLSYVGWTLLLDQSPFRGGSIETPTLPATDLQEMQRLKRGLGVVYNRLVATRPGRALMRAVGPLFHVVATRDPDATPSPMPHPATMPTA